MNDQMNSVLNRYEAYKKGDYTVAANPIPPELASGSAPNDLSLIDFDESQPSNHAAPPGNDLAGLFSTTSAAPPQPLFNTMAGGNIGLHSAVPAQPQYQFNPTTSNMAGGMNMGSTPPIPTHSPMPMPFNQNGAFRPSSMSPPQSTPPASIMLPSTPSNNSAPNYFGTSTPNATGPVRMGNGTGMGTSMGGMYGGMQTMQPMQQQPPSNTTNQVQGKDPFADLAGLF